MANTTLYDGSSASPDSRVFQLDGPVTVQAVGLAPDDVVYFEVIHLSKVSPSQVVCGCYVYELEKAHIDGIERLTCPTCESEDEQFVRLTPRNTTVILDLPQGAFLRAYYEGSGLGTSRVWFATGADVKDLTPELRGCPPVCCEDRVWTATGERRCDPDADLVELQEVSNCGTLRWVTSGSIPWQDTGETRCTDTQVQKQQISPCGDVRWINSEAITWADTGVTRCNSTHYQKQQVSPCGDVQWVNEEALVWTDTANFRCRNGQVQQEQTNQCGNTRWTDTGAFPWSDTGTTRCSATHFQVQQINPCGDTQWIDSEPLSWTDTGQYRCQGGQVQKEQANQCGNTRWTDSGTVPWNDTGATRCTATHLQKQQVNPCGEYQWVNEGPVVWTNTGVTQDDGTNVLVQQVNQCGEFQWVQGDALAWVDTGTERCKDGLVQLYQLNQQGQGRWVNTARECVAPEYFATLPMPCCGGLAYRPEDLRDPAATIEIVADCDTPYVKGYLYPTPREGAQTPVLTGDCEDVCNDTVLGYAVDNPSVKNCDHCGHDNMTVRLGDKVAVNYVEAGSGRAYILWSDGSMTLTNLH